MEATSYPNLFMKFIRWVIRKRRMVQIMSMYEGQEYETKKHTLKCTYRHKMGGDFRIFHRQGINYWPHDRVHFHATANTWHSDFIVPNSDTFPADDISIVVMELSQTARKMVDYYFAVGHKAGWHPFEFGEPVEGFTEFYQVTIKRKNPGSPTA